MANKQRSPIPIVEGGTGVANPPAESAYASTGASNYASAESYVSELKYLATGGTSTYIDSQWLPCDATAYAKASYPELYARLGDVTEYNGELGVTYSAQVSTFTQACQGVAQHAISGVWAVVGSNEGTQYSTDGGISWTNATTTTSLISVWYGNGFLLAVGNNGRCASSTDGITWTTRTSGTASSLRLGAYNSTAGLFVIATSGGTVMTTTDAITFNTNTTTTTTQLNWSTYDSTSGLYAVAGNGGYLATSTDAVTWTPQVSTTTAQLTGVNRTNGVWFSTANNVILTSTDAVTWVSQNVPITGATQVLWTGSKFVLNSRSYMAYTSGYGTYWQNERMAISVLIGGMQAFSSDGTYMIAVSNNSNPNIIWKSGPFATTSTTSFQVPKENLSSTMLTPQSQMGNMSLYIKAERTV